MKTLIIIIHPNLKSSLINKRWMEELYKYPEKFSVHDLYGHYPDEKIDVAREQQLVGQFDKIIFQFPFYWFSSPPLLKKWFDEVLTYGWAYGSNSGYPFRKKKVALAITAGIEKEEYSPMGTYQYSLKQLTAPFELTFNYIKANYHYFYAFYGMEHNASKQWAEQSVPGYLDFLENL